LRTVHHHDDHLNGFGTIADRTPAIVKILAAPAVYAVPPAVSVETLPAPAMYAAPPAVVVKTLTTPEVSCGLPCGNH